MCVGLWCESYDLVFCRFGVFGFRNYELEYVGLWVYWCGVCRFESYEFRICELGFHEFGFCGYFILQKKLIFK